MTDKEIRSLSKVQMLDLMILQEKEIERLTDELEKARLAKEKQLFDGVLKAAQDAADAYIKKFPVTSNNDNERIAQMEANALNRLKEAEFIHDKVVSSAKKMIADLYEAYNWQVESTEKARDEFRRRISTTSLKNLLP